MDEGTGVTKQSLSMVERGSRKHTMETRKLEHGSSSNR
jgi:hypothetical protein